jgi:DUF971 family protein
MTSFAPKRITRSDPARIVIEWDDGRTTTYTAAELRGLCPCARCVDEISGRRVHEPASVPDGLTQHDARLVGNYGLALRFSDGHDTGIFPFRMLRERDPAGA